MKKPVSKVAAASKVALAKSNLTGGVSIHSKTDVATVNFLKLPFPQDLKGVTTSVRREVHAAARRVGANAAARTTLKDTLTLLGEYVDAAYERAVSDLAASQAKLAEERRILAERAAIRAELIPVRVVTVSARDDGSFVELNDRGEVANSFSDLNRSSGVLAGLAVRMMDEGFAASTTLKVMAFGREAALSGRTLMELSMTTTTAPAMPSKYRLDEPDDYDADADPYATQS